MKSIRERLNKWEIRWEHLSDSFLLYHPYIGFAVAAVGLADRNSLVGSRMHDRRYASGVLCAWMNNHPRDRYLYILIQSLYERMFIKFILTVMVLESQSNIS